MLMVMSLRLRYGHQLARRRCGLSPFGHSPVELE